MKSKSIFFFASVSLLNNLAQGALLVDFSGNTANVDQNAAGFIVASGSLSPQSAIFTAGTQGYSSPAMDTGAGINAVLRVYATSGSYVNLLQLINRNSAAADLQSDWAFQGGTFDGEMARVGLKLTLTGLKTGEYNFSSYHFDAGGMGGVMDTQYSVNGGQTWINTTYDNASFSGGLMMNLEKIPVSAASGLQVRYLVGGNLFGTPGVARSGSYTNFLLPHNSFSIEAVPEPSLTLLLLSGIPLFLVRRRAKAHEI